MSGLARKWVLASVPGLGEVKRYVYVMSDPNSVPCLGLLRNCLAARPWICSQELLGVLFDRHLTISSELARTRGIRLSN